MQLRERVQRLTGKRRFGLSAAGRFLVIVWAFLLAVMPLTEHFWTFDRFLRGGSQDFELSVCTLVAVLCLVLLMAQYARRGLTLVLALRRWLRFVSQPGKIRAFHFFLRTRDVLSPALPAAVVYALPMQI